ALVVLYRQGRRVPWPAIVTLVAFAGLGAIAVRGVAWWPLVAAVTLAALSSRSRDRVEEPMAPAPTPVRGSPLNAAVAVVLGLAAIMALPLWRPLDPGTLAPDRLLGHAPSTITAVLRDHATAADRVWNAQVWGSWLEFAVPEPAYAFDSRIEVIPPEAWDEGDRVVAVEPGWDAILDAHGVTIVVADGGPASRLATALANHRGWRLVATEAAGTLWFRADR
ncbi:MAG TPA: hypothetical protein VFV53_10870, partial [Candidatus Limnocylindrales bacterium]|nr:hypothetical protein [Candidatus Limnocylindrales bacterium]